MKLRCWWFGCEKHPQDCAPPDRVTCMYCNECISYADLVGDTRHYHAINYMHRIYRFIWPKRCNECGHKWTACDNNIDHIPF